LTRRPWRRTADRKSICLSFGGVRYDRSNDPDLADLREGDEPRGEGPARRNDSPAVESEP